MFKKEPQKKNVAEFFTLAPSQERTKLLRQAVRESNRDQKKILDYYRSRKLKKA